MGCVCGGGSCRSLPLYAPPVSPSFVPPTQLEFEGYEFIAYLFIIKIIFCKLQSITRKCFWILCKYQKGLVTTKGATPNMTVVPQRHWCLLQVDSFTRSMSMYLCPSMACNSCCPGMTYNIKEAIDSFSSNQSNGFLISGNIWQKKLVKKHALCIQWIRASGFDSQSDGIAW